MAMTSSGAEVVPGSGSPRKETDETVRLHAQVSNAVNLRRIALVVVLGVVLIVGTTLITLVTTADLIDRSGELTLLRAWVILAMSILVGGALIIIYDKHLTRRNW